MKKFKVIELFGGIGACSKALKNLGVDYEVVDYVEIDKYAVKSYNAINNTNFEPQDITTWGKVIYDNVDLIMHGSPCQDFSLAGSQKGGDKGSGTRSSLMYETIRIVKNVRPKYVIWENVKNLLSSKHKHNFDNYITQMRMLGYTSYYKVLNASDFGIPQNRERVFVVSVRSDVNSYGCHQFNYRFPDNQTENCEIIRRFVKDFLTNEEHEYLNDKQLTYILDGNDVALSKGRNINNRIVNPRIAKTISCRGAADQRADVTNFVYNDNEVEITVKDLKELIKQGSDVKVRKLSPRECWLLMGFSNEDYNKASEVNSKTQLYKQAGNSIVVNVIQAILKELIEQYEK